MADDGTGPADLPMARWPEVAALPGARACLEALAGRPLAVATNATVSRRDDVVAALARVDLARFFEHVFCLTDLGCSKKEPGFWAAVERTLGVPLQRVAMVGDSLEHDVLGPRAFGVQAVWLDPSGGAAPAGVLAVRRLEDFARWVLES